MRDSQGLWGAGESSFVGRAGVCGVLRVGG